MINITESNTFRYELFNNILNGTCLNLQKFILNGVQPYDYISCKGQKINEKYNRITKSDYYKLSKFLKEYQYLKTYTEQYMKLHPELTNSIISSTGDYRMPSTISKNAEYCNRIQDVLDACLHQGIMHTYSKEQMDYLKLKTALLPLVLSDTSSSKKFRMCAENSYIFLCPIHTERTPSFRVYDSTNSYYCYGCGNSGNIIKYIKETNGLTYKESIDLLLKIFMFQEKNKQDPRYNVIKKYQDSITSDEYQALLELGRQRITRYGNILMPSRTETIDEYYRQKYATIKRIKNNQLDTTIINSNLPDSIILDFKEPVENTKARKQLVKTKNIDFYDIPLDDDLPF